MYGYTRSTGAKRVSLHTCPALIKVHFIFRFVFQAHVLRQRCFIHSWSAQNQHLLRELDNVSGVIYIIYIVAWEHIFEPLMDVLLWKPAGALCDSQDAFPSRQAVKASFRERWRSDCLIHLISSAWFILTSSRHALIRFQQFHIVQLQVVILSFSMPLFLEPEPPNWFTWRATHNTVHRNWMKLGFDLSTS